ncbi:MAG: Glu-tRNA(Gln) amidotransferase subunit GatE [Bacteroidales bacterium]|nr:Glu-tRNA(Gln) amidotransferase subunit GatE [Bacteroidales bacterium]MCF6341781.1 Glu-tRNA(Gln) amidotransferase subunit GatE [Bacteroidales bacterium]
MQKVKFDPKRNYRETMAQAGYVARKEANRQTYDTIGFMSGLEVHQQLLTKEKMFCHCPAGFYNHSDDYDAEIIRHMRPTLSELGEYDGTALMEFKTRKEIVYRIKNETACTYEIDDTPPFPLNRESLEIALEISLLSKLNVVGEVHITRKQYLDGSIPAGFQRTAILGVEGELELPHKKIRLIQLSIEEDSCREISDIGHTRTYKTDRLGMPLIETVTYPDCVNPDEVMETCNYIRFLNRSTGKVRTGMGAGRQDVNVSCRGGSRVEIKGVAHTKWIPELTHNEAFRQWSLLLMRNRLKTRVPRPGKWKIKFLELGGNLQLENRHLKKQAKAGLKLIAVNLPYFLGMLSWFTQPGKMFANEISDRLKVIACLEKPNLFHSEAFRSKLTKKEWAAIATFLKAKDEDAQLVFWAAEEDVKTALETIEERCLMAFEGVPEETRKSLEDGTTIFERVLPGADRMYPDTDSAPIPLEDAYIQQLSQNLPEEIIDRYKKLKRWGVPEDTYTYIFSKNLFPLVERIINVLNIRPAFVGTFIGHGLKYAEGRKTTSGKCDYENIYRLFRYLKEKGLHEQLAEKMLPEIIEHPKLDFDSVLTSIKFKRIEKDEIISKIPLLKEKFNGRGGSPGKGDERNWVMGQLRNLALGNMDLTELSKMI